MQMASPHANRHYTQEQFAADEYFQQWVLHPDEKNTFFWNSYLEENPQQQRIILNARLMVEELAANEYGMEPLSDEEKSILKQNIYRELKLDTYATIPIRKKWPWSWAIAASLLLVAVCVYLIIRPMHPEAALLTAQTGERETREILLSDSSVVILNAGSSLQYHDDFSKDAIREVYLQGNAFFEVRKDAGHKPFIVHTSTLGVSVLGTRFNVDARSPATQVVLTSGKVKITEKTGQDSAFMNPGEKIEWDAARHTLVKTKTDTQLYSAWTEKLWRFRETSLQDIASLLREYYGVNTVFRNEKNRQLRMSGVIPVTSLDMLAQVIAKTLHVKIEENNKVLIIQ